MRPKFFVIWEGYGCVFTRTYINQEALDSDCRCYGGYKATIYEDDGTNFVKK